MADPPGARPLFFDLWSLFYDTPWVQRLSYRPVHDAVLAELPDKPGLRVLDVGCGTGLLSERVARTLPGARVAGCDFSDGMLRHAARRSASVDFVRGDAQAIPFRDASFDAVVSTEAFHWFPDQPRALREFHRVLAPGGRLLLAFVNMPVDAMTRIGHAGTRLLGEPATWPTRPRLRRQVERAGFRIESQRRVYRLPLGLLLPPTLTVAVRAEPARRKP